MENPKWEYICSEKMAILYGGEKHQMGLVHMQVALEGVSSFREFTALLGNNS